MNADSCPSELQLDGYLLAGKPATDPVAAHLAGCARCQARLGEIEAQAAAFHREVFPATLERVLDAAANDRADSSEHGATTEQTVAIPLAVFPLSAPAPVPVLIPAPLPSPSKRPCSFLSSLLRPWPLAAVAAGAACLVLGLWVGRQWAREAWGEARRVVEQRAPLDAPYVGLKGGPGLQVWARRGEAVFEVGEGTRLREGDRVRFAPRLPGPGYVMILSVDAHGQVSLHHPHGGERALELRPPLSAAALAGSVELDESRGPERIFLLFSTADFERAAVERAARDGLAAQGSVEALRALPLADIEQTSLLILKE